MLRQVYDNYTPEDFTVWRLLYERQMQQLPQLASQAYLDGLAAMRFSADKIPNFDDINALLHRTTGWEVTVVAGLIPQKDTSSSTASKIKKSEPFFTAVQNGLVFIVESGWDRKTLEYFYRECENFDGVTKSTRTIHDDFVDAVGTAFNYLNTVKVYTVPKLGAFAAPPPSVKAIALADI